MEEKKQDDVIRLGDIFRVLWKNIILVAIVAVVIFVFGIIYTYVIARPQYRAEQTFVVAVTDGDGAVTQGAPSAGIINTVSSLAVGYNVLNPVAEANGLSYGDLREMVTVSSETNNYLIKIAVECGDPDLAAKLANEIFASLSDYVEGNSIDKYYGCTVIESSPATFGAYTSPNKALYLALFFVGGLAAGCIVVYAKEFCTNRFRGKEDVENYLGARVIGYFVNDRAKDSAKNGGREMAGLVKPDMRNYEPYNKLLTNIKYSNVDDPYRVIMVTSSQERELKSSTLANFACCIAYNNHKVLLIDMDMRKPVQHKLFNVSKEKGIIEYVDGSCTAEEIVKHTNYGVDVITAGKRVINPVVIIESANFKKLLSELRGQYDYILLDTPPLLVCSDAAAISKLCDGVIFNMAIKDVRKKMVAAAMRSLRDVNARIIGVNVTKAAADKRDEAYYYYGDKYYANADEEDASFRTGSADD